MRESRTYGSVRGALRNERPYRDLPHSLLQHESLSVPNYLKTVRDLAKSVVESMKFKKSPNGASFPVHFQRSSAHRKVSDATGIEAEP